MAKNKRKSNLANSTAEKKNKSVKLNPFDIRFNREKHTVLNRKKKSSIVFKSKSNNEAVGRPGIARSRAIQKRKETLLQEYKIRNKANVFVDKRIGEKDADLSAEDKMIARFTMERMKNSGKKNKFNLGEEENLTHYGQSISEIEQFDDDPRSDDEEEEKNKKMDAEMNFGGFMTKSDVEFSTGKGNSRQDYIEEIIAESKKRKFEQQKDKEEALKKTQDLDSKWKDIFKDLKSDGSCYAKKIKDDDETEENDDYNKIMKELVFDPKKAKAQERLKTDEEIITDQKEMLEKLEELRQKRMRGEGIEENEQDEQDEKDEESEGENEQEDEDEQSEDDQFSDLDESGSDDEPEVSEKKKKAQKKAKKLSTTPKTPENTTVTKEIPFTFSVPKSSEDLEDLFESRSAKEKSIIIERMIKCNHPQFGKNNKEQLENLFTFILQHIYDCASIEETDDDIEDNLESVQKLVPFLFDLAKFSPQPSGEAVRSVLQEKYEDFCKSPKIYPGLDSLIFLKITTLLFPTSDYRHPVTTPACQWMSQMLSGCKVNSRQSLASGLFVASIMAESVSLSKKFSPELMNFLTGIIFMSIPKDKTTIIPFVTPFKVVGPDSTLLADILRENENVKPDKLQYQDCIKSSKIDGVFASTVLKTSLDLLKHVSNLWSGLPSAPEILLSRLHEELLPKLLETEKYLHPEIVESVKSLTEVLSKVVELKNVNRSHTVPKHKKEIKMLRLYDPELDENFDPFVKKRNLSKDKQELAKLNHKLKREKKGAKKDLRADAAFLQRLKFKEKRDKDADRMAKTKAILGGLGGQEGEYRQMQKQKKKKKF